MKLHNVGQDTFGIITNFRDSFSRQENEYGLIELKNYLLAKGLKPTEFIGEWKGKKEISLFVPDISYQLIIKLMLKYGQDSVIYNGQETKNQTMIIFRDGSMQLSQRF